MKAVVTQERRCCTGGFEVKEESLAGNVGSSSKLERKDSQQILPECSGGKTVLLTP